MSTGSGTSDPGVLDGLVVLEVGGIGPLQLLGMMLADLGADVIRVDRFGGADGAVVDPSIWLYRGRRSIAIDLKSAKGVEVLLDLVEHVDVLVEGFRPGVAERLGFGPDVCLGRNPGLVYGRMTGWGTDGPLADKGGHDINYISLSGALHAIGPAGSPPAVPLNLVGDYGGGAMFLAMGLLAALRTGGRGGTGQVVEAAMLDGALTLMAQWYAARARGGWSDVRGTNLIDGGAPFYGTYETSDGGYMAVGAVEPKFYVELLDGLGLDASLVASQYDEETWPTRRKEFEAVFATRTRAEWTEEFAGRDACTTPVLSMAEASDHPQNAGRLVDAHGLVQVAPALRWSGVRSPVSAPAPTLGAHTDEVLAGVGYDATMISTLREADVVR